MRKTGEKEIYHRKQEKERKRMPAGTVIFGLLGILCVVYCISIGVNGFGTKFFLIWGAMGAAFLFIGFLLTRREFIASLPKWLKIAAVSGFCAAAVLFILVEGLIFSMYGGNARPGADYLIVLGAQWKRSGPSEVLRRRLDTAVKYLRENPRTLAVVSGGQGPDELIAEAEGMRQYLIDAGIDAERILTEDKSTNTRENLAFSAGLIDKEEGRTVIVTNNFHVFRAVKIAQKQGYQAEGLAAGSVAWMAPNNLLREFLGVLKDFLVGNL